MLAGLFTLFLWLQAQPSLDAAKRLISEGKMEEAAQILGAMDPAFEPAYLLGLAHYNLGNHRQAAEALLHAIREAPEGSHIRLEVPRMLGQSLYVTGRLKEAIPWLAQAHRNDADNVEVSYMLGNCYLLDGQAEKAAGAFARMFSVSGNSAAGYLITGQMAVRHELNGLAKQLLRQALELDVKVPEAHYLLALVAIFDGDVDTGIEELHAEIAVNPNFAMAYYRLGEAYSRQGKWDMAIPQLQKAVWLNPTHSGPFILLGKGYLQREEHANAEAMLRKAIEMDPNNDAAHYLLGQTLIKAGRPEEGKRILKRSVEIRDQREAPPLTSVPKP